MPQYAVIQSHPPGNWPIASKAAREWANRQMPNMEKVASEHGVKLVTSYLHLDPSHKALLVLEAPNAESVRDFLVMAGFFHFTDMQLYLTTPVPELLKMTGNIPTIFP